MKTVKINLSMLENPEKSINTPYLTIKFYIINPKK